MLCAVSVSMEGVENGFGGTKPIAIHHSPIWTLSSAAETTGNYK